MALSTVVERIQLVGHLLVSHLSSMFHYMELVFRIMEHILIRSGGS